MQKNSNQLRSGVILSYINLFVNAAIQLAYGPILIRILGKSEYGLYTLVGSVINYLTLFGFGLNGTYIRFYSRYKSQKDEKKIAEMNGMYFSVFVILGLLAFVCGIVLSLFPEAVFGSKLTSEELAKARILLIILSANLFLTFPNSVYNSIITAHEKFIFQRIISLMGYIFNPVLGIICLLAGYKAVAICIITTVVTLAKVVTNGYYVKKYISVSFHFGVMDFALIREIAVFSFFIFLNMIIDQVNWSTDNYILGRVKGTSEVALYGVGSTINTIYLSISSAISSVFIPRVNRIANTEDETQMKKSFSDLFIRVGRIQFIVLGLVVSGFTLYGEYFINHIYATNEYRLSYNIALLLIWPETIPLIQNVGIEIQRSINKHQIRSIIYFAMAIINILISIPLAKSYGAVGAAIGTTVSIIVANGLIMNIYYYKVIGIDVPLFWRNIVRLVLVGIVPIIVGIVLKRVYYGDLFQFVINILIYTIVYVGSFYFLGMNVNEKEDIKKIITKRKNKNE